MVCFVFSPLLLSFLICTRNLISIPFHPAEQCYLLFCFLPIIDSALQNRLQLLAELFFPLGTEKKKVYEKKVFTKLIFQVLSGLRFRQDLAGNSRLFLLSFISSECTASSVRTAFQSLVVAEVMWSFL